MKFNKVFFENKINKIKSIDLKNYFLTFFSLKQILIKTLLFIVVAFIVCLPSFLARHFFYESGNYIANTGISFGWLSGLSPSIVLLVQIIPCVISFLFLFFINNIWISASFSVIFFAGLCNIIDRATFPIIGAVIDYINFGNSVINIPDIFINIGCGLVLISTIVWVVQMYKKPENDKPKNNNEKQKNINEIS